jgi:threonine dehydratase
VSVLTNRSDYEEAAERLRGIAVRTPVLPWHGSGEDSGLFIKPEILQPSGSFKIRGIYHAVSRLYEAQRRRGLSTVSAGNTAKALAWCGRHFGVPVHSRMPDTAPKAKIDAFRALGGIPTLEPAEDLFRFIRERGWEAEPYAFVDPWRDPDVHLGHGTIGLEILADRPDVETVFLPVGGGGLFAGVAGAIHALKPSVRIVAVEPEGCPSLHAAILAGRPVDVPCATMCDGVAVPFITEEMFPRLRTHAAEVVLVSEAAVRSAIRRIAATSHFVAEGAGALAIAAALATPRVRRGVCVALLTGGSIDPALLVSILAEADPGG